MDEFSGMLQGGGVSFNPKSNIADFGPLHRALNRAYLETKLQYDFPKLRGGGQWPFGIFPKMHPFWCRQRSLKKAPFVLSIFSLCTFYFQVWNLPSLISLW